MILSLSFGPCFLRGKKVPCPMGSPMGSLLWAVSFGRVRKGGVEGRPMVVEWDCGVLGGYICRNELVGCGEVSKESERDRSRERV